MMDSLRRTTTIYSFLFLNLNISSFVVVVVVVLNIFGCLDLYIYFLSFHFTPQTPRFIRWSVRREACWHLARFLI